MLFIQSNFVYQEGLAIANDQSLLASGLIDSTNVLELISFMEEEFEIQVGDEDLIPANLDSIDRITSYVGRKLGENDPDAST